MKRLKSLLIHKFSDENTVLIECTFEVRPHEHIQRPQLQEQ